MIPIIRSLSELMAITTGREIQRDASKIKDLHVSTVDSGQRKRYLRSLNKKEVDLPSIPKTIRRKWMHNKKHVSRFIDDLDYNNQIQPSYELTLLERQNEKNQQDIA